MLGLLAPIDLMLHTDNKYTPIQHDTYAFMKDEDQASFSINLYSFIHRFYVAVIGV